MFFSVGKVDKVGIKKCTRLWHQAHVEVKILKALQVRWPFGSCVWTLSFYEFAHMKSRKYPPHRNRTSTCVGNESWVPMAPVVYTFSASKMRVCHWVCKPFPCCTKMLNKGWAQTFLNANARTTSSLVGYYPTPFDKNCVAYCNATPFFPDNW